MASPPPAPQASDVRIDKWLWAARFYKTRSLASQDIAKGRVEVNGQVAKASRDLKPGDLILLRQGPMQRTLRVLALSAVRGPAPVAQALYAETPESVAQREAQARQRHCGGDVGVLGELGCGLACACFQNDS